MRLKVVLLFILINISFLNKSFSQKKHHYNSDITFSIDKVEKWSGIATGNGHYYVNKGFKYFLVHLTFQNNSNKKQEINFDKFHLIDINNKIKYKNEFVMHTTVINMFSKKQKKINGNKILKRKVVFICPENLDPNFLLLDMKIISINNSNNTKDGNTIQKFEFDIDFVEFIKNKWNLIKYEKSNLPKFNRLKAFHSQLKRGNENILFDYFMENPDNNLLLAEYLNTKLKWNMFNPENERLTTEMVIEKNLYDLPERNEMLAFYYKTIFVNLLNHQGNIKPYEKNLDFNKLGLNETEGAILFLTAMRHLGNQISSYSKHNFPDNCFRADLFIEKMPTFNGNVYYEFELPNFKDFEIEIDKRYPKVSFKKYFILEFENAKIDYMKCLNSKN